MSGTNLWEQAYGQKKPLHNKKTLNFKKSSPMQTFIYSQGVSGL